MRGNKYCTMHQKQKAGSSCHLKHKKQKAGSSCGSQQKTKQRGGAITSVADYALSSTKNYNKVHKFLVSKYNQENIEFLKLVQEYKKQPTVARLVDIYFQYVDKDSDNQVNLPSHIQKEIEDYIFAVPIGTLDADPTFYDKAKDDIEKLLNANYLKNFQK
jgi:hypothetical protein